MLKATKKQKHSKVQDLKLQTPRFAEIYADVHSEYVRKSDSIDVRPAMYLWKQPAHLWDDLHKKIRPLAVHQPADHDYDHLIGSVGVPIRLKLSSINCIGDDEHFLWRQARSQHCVLLARVGHTDRLLNVSQSELQDLVHVNAAQV